MRKAKISAKLTLERRSNAVMRWAEASGRTILEVADRRDEESGTVVR
jgi:hypothetical protein